MNIYTKQSFFYTKGIFELLLFSKMIFSKINTEIYFTINLYFLVN